MKTIHTIPSDIDTLFKNGCTPSEENLNTFLTNVRAILIDQLTKREPKEPSLRMSKLGTPDRKLWFDHNSPEPETDVENRLKFTYGHIIEQLVLFLVKEAGHEVTEEQGQVEIDGVKGSKDARIDGTCIDIKSASSFAFRKFADGSLLTNDPFGYVAQLSAYSWPDPAAFIAVNKENGQITVLDLEPVDQIDPKVRIARCKEVVALPEPPKTKCYPEEDFGKSGNKKVNSNCNYCSHKFKCWEGLRSFEYSTGIVHLTKVVDTPRVNEVTGQSQ